MEKYADNHGWDFGISKLVEVVPNTKEASKKHASEAYEYATAIPKKADRTPIIVIAMGTTDSYGPNRNADGFSRRMLKEFHPTFERFGHVFVNHKNKNPKESYGEILKSFFNPSMDRVELVLSLFNDRSEKFIQRINEDKPLAVSMGINIPYDVCSICGHRSPTTRQWCKHMQRKGPFGPNSIYYSQNDPMYEHSERDGNLIFVHNPAGKFFDISMLSTKPADQTAYMIYGPRGLASASAEKLASLGVAYEDMDSFVEHCSKAAGLNYQFSSDGYGMHATYNPDSLQAVLSTKKPHLYGGAKTSKMFKKVEGLGVGLKAFKEDPKYLSGKAVEDLSVGGVDTVKESLRRSKLSMNFTDIFNIYHTAMKGKFASAEILERASGNQGAFVEFIENNPAVRACMKTAMILSPHDPHLRVSKVKDSSHGYVFSMKPPTSVEHSSSKQAALCGLLAADAILDMDLGVEEICRGFSYGDSKLANYNGFTDHIKIGPSENVAKYLTRAINDFARIIF